jgi:hypothetical protein
LPEIRSWQDYPEFLERVEEELEVTSEDLATLTLDELASALYDFNPKIASIKTAQWLKKSIRATSEEGMEGARIEWIDMTERYIWRDVRTGRFVSAPSGLFD